MFDPHNDLIAADATDEGGALQHLVHDEGASGVAVIDQFLGWFSKEAAVIG